MDPPSPTERSGRRYRSKKQRPCDLCRSRKIQCKWQENEIACEPCKRSRRQCTFLLEPLKRKRRPMMAEDEDVNHLQAGRMLGDGNDSAQMFGDMPFLDIDDSDIAIDLGSFLPPTANNCQALSPSLLPANWSGVHFPLGRSPLRLPESENHGGPGHVQVPCPGGDNQFHHVPTSEQRAEQLPNIDPVFAGSPQGTASSTNSGGSQIDVPDVGGQNNGRSVSLAMGAGMDDFPRRSSNAANAMDVERDDSRASDWPAEFSLDWREGFSHQLIGLSSELDPYLLRHYQYDATDTYSGYRLHYRKAMEDARSRPYDHNPPTGQPRLPAGDFPVQFVLNDGDIWKEDAEATERILAGGSVERDDLEYVNRLVPVDIGSRLVTLYTLFVHSRFPALSLFQLKQMPGSDDSLAGAVGIQSAVYALAAPFSYLDDALSVMKGYFPIPTEKLWAVARRSFQRANCSSHLTLLQLCLLLLQAPPQNFVAAEPPSAWELSCSALAIAENLGVNLEPCDWRLPRKEIMLRRRLWWLTYTLHTWQAVVLGRPSHINDTNWDVSELTMDDFELDEHQGPRVKDAIEQGRPICIAECDLSTITAEVLRKFYTLKATREPSTLDALWDRAQHVLTRIDIWRQRLHLLAKPVSELNECEFANVSTAKLSHLIVQILIFRVLHRRLFQAVPVGENPSEPIATIFERCHASASAVTELVSCMSAKHFASFWPTYVRYQLCYVSSFMLMNLAHSPTREIALRSKALLDEWRNTLRTQARAWPLARLATMRLDAVFWRGLASAIHGAGPDSLALMLLKEG